MGVEYSINVTEYYDSNKLSSADIKDEIDFSKKQCSETCWTNFPLRCFKNYHMN